jgi:hypothetical protein
MGKREDLNKIHLKPTGKNVPLPSSLPRQLLEPHRTGPIWESASKGLDKKNSRSTMRTIINDAKKKREGGNKEKGRGKERATK